MAKTAAPKSTSSQPRTQATAEEIGVADQRIATAIADQSVDSPGRVVVVYFTPREREPAANHVDRIRRITEETASFYQRELERHGFADRRMNVLRGDDDLVEVIDVVGADKDYDKPDGQRIRQEVIAVLREKQIDPQRSVLLLFCNLMDYDPVQSTISHHSPYYGGGTPLTGTAWQCDSEILDPLRFKDPTPITDGEYGRITIGRHNSIFIGGVIHELGHALSLPHCRQRQDESDRGTSLMGSGNRTYAQQLRGEGRGTFLTQTHAMRLAAHPVFNTHAAKSLYNQPETEWENLRVNVDRNSVIRLDGKVHSKIPIHSVIAYFDPAGGGDYDATTASAVPDDQGNFALQSDRLPKNVPGQLRLLTCHVNGATVSREMNYGVDDQGRPDLSSIRVATELQPMIDAIRSSDLGTAKDALHRITSEDPSLRAIGQRVLDRFTDRSSATNIRPDTIADSVQTIALSQLKPASESVGWMRPAYDRVPDDQKLLSIDGDFFASGIYAHAPAEHQYKIDGRWRRLQGRCGMQIGHPGKVDFQINGDDRVLWNSQGITESQSASFDVDISDVKVLTLSVTDGGNGKGEDWGVWIEPTLSR